MTLEKAKHILAYNDKHPGRLGFIGENGGDAVAEVREINEARAVVAQHEAQPKTNS